jgi:hypothetical protein
MSFGRKQPLPPLDELRQRFGANVRQHREQLGVSQHELAFRADTHITKSRRSSWGRNFRGSTPLFAWPGRWR